MLQIQQELANESRTPMLDVTGLESGNSQISEINNGIDGDIDFKKMKNGEDPIEESQVNREDGEPKEVHSMDVYEELQDPEKRLILTNIKQF